MDYTLELRVVPRAESIQDGAEERLEIVAFIKRHADSEPEFLDRLRALDAALTASISYRPCGIQDARHKRLGARGHATPLIARPWLNTLAFTLRFYILLSFCV